MPSHAQSDPQQLPRCVLGVWPSGSQAPAAVCSQPPGSPPQGRPGGRAQVMRMTTNTVARSCPARPPLHRRVELHVACPGVSRYALVCHCTEMPTVPEMPLSAYSVQICHGMLPAPVAILGQLPRAHALHWRAVRPPALPRHPLPCMPRVAHIRPICPYGCIAIVRHHMPWCAISAAMLHACHVSPFSALYTLVAVNCQPSPPVWPCLPPH